MTDEPSGLTIRQVAELTGVSQATLRKWEQRYGFPEPRRGPSGRRHYTEGDVERVRSVLEAREAGLSLRSAIERSSEHPAPAESSIFSLLYRRHGLRPFRTDPQMLLRITRAIEDEALARAEQGLAVGCFQREADYRRSRERWQQLAQVSAITVARSDFDSTGYDGRVALVPFEPDSPLAREWSLTCSSGGRGACVAAWEVPAERSGEGRLYETVWTTEPFLVYEAAKCALGLAGAVMPGLGAGAERHLGSPPPPSSREVRGMAELSARIVGYMATPRKEPSGR